MPTPHKEIEEFHYMLQSRNLSPGGSTTIKGRVWAQNRPLYCPWCGVVFYAYQPQDKPMKPYEQQDGQMRITCGHPLCREAEVKDQIERSTPYLAARRAYDESKNIQPAAKLQKRELSSIREAV